MIKPIIYLYFHSRILNWKGKEMKEKEFKSCFFQWRIPKNLRDLIMKEMQEIGLLKREKGKVILNNYYFEKDFKKTSTDFKDGDTKIENPYLSKDLL